MKHHSMTMDTISTIQSKPARSRRAWPLAIALALSAATAATAQNDLGCTVASLSSMDSASETALRRFVTEQTALLAGTDALAGARAREALLAPLSCENVSVAFRLKYAEALEPALLPLIQGTDDRVAVGALRVAGKVGASGVVRLLEAGLAHSNEAIRLAAASGYRELLSQLAVDSFGFPEASVNRLLSTVADALAKEPNPFAADAMVIALADATRGNASLRSRALGEMVRGLETRLRSIRTERGINSTAWSAAAFRGLDLSRLALLEQIAAGAVDRSFATRLGKMGGQALAFARDFAPLASESERPSIGEMVGAAEVTLVITHNALTGTKVGEGGLRQSFQSAIDGSFSNEASARFAEAASSWIGASGMLTKGPYNAGADEFAPSN